MPTNLSITNAKNELHKYVRNMLINFKKLYENTFNLLHMHINTCNFHLINAIISLKTYRYVWDIFWRHKIETTIFVNCDLLDFTREQINAFPNG